MQITINMTAEASTAPSLATLKRGDIVAAKNDDGKWDLGTVKVKGSVRIVVETHDAEYEIKAKSASKWLKAVDVSSMTSAKLKKAMKKSYSNLEIAAFEGHHKAPVKTKVVKPQVKKPADRIIDLRDPDHTTSYEDHAAANASYKVKIKQAVENLRKLATALKGKIEIAPTRRFDDTTLVDIYFRNKKHDFHLSVYDGTRSTVKLYSRALGNRTDELIQSIKKVANSHRPSSSVTMGYGDGYIANFMYVTDFSDANYAKAVRFIKQLIKVITDSANGTKQAKPKPKPSNKLSEEEIKGLFPAKSKKDVADSILDEVVTRWGREIGNRSGDIDWHTYTYKDEIHVEWNLTFRRNNATGAFFEYRDQISKANNMLEVIDSYLSKSKAIKVKTARNHVNAKYVNDLDESRSRYGESDYSEYEQSLGDGVVYVVK